MSRFSNASYWDSVSDQIQGPLLQEDVAAYYRDEHLALMRDWIGDFHAKKILKTDLYEEAIGDYGFLFSSPEDGVHFFGMDISPKIASRAKKRSAALSHISFPQAVVSDVRSCSFKDSVFDAAISNSTLDHLSFQDAGIALAELRRIIKSGGVLILTLDNRHNPFFLMGYLAQKFLGVGRFYLDRCYTLAEAKHLAEESGFVVEATMPLVHIYPPLTRIFFILEKMRLPCARRLIRSLIRFLSRLGSRQTRFLTSWFIAIKLRNP
jgi:SAM-dependent methyltransferase